VNKEPDGKASLTRSSPRIAAYKAVGELLITTGSNESIALPIPASAAEKPEKKPSYTTDAVEKLLPIDKQAAIATS
jgi:hypothetical protein